MGLRDSNDLPYSLMFQLTHITKDRNSLRHDDRLDALSLAVSYWLDRNILEQNIDKALESYKQRKLDERLKALRSSYRNNPLVGRDNHSKRAATSHIRSYN
jgi:hypothetical protein